MKSFLKNKQFGRGIRKAAVLTAAIASLGFASASWAAPITIKHLSTEGKTGNITGYSNVKAGLFNFNVVTPPAASTAEWNSTLQAFCIDINNTLVINSNVIYDIVPATGTGAGGLTSLQLSRVSWLFDNHFADLGSSKNAAAFQLSLWEIFFEKPGSAFDLTKGDFTSTTFESARQVANGWLSGVPTSDDYTSDRWEFYTLNPINPENNQRLITWREKDPSVSPQEISEPGTLLLLSIGLGVAFFSTRRRSEMQLASLA